eukprot:SAG11_NODE_157_length_14147_cov_8.545202_13_plen_122_part_00
MQGGDAGRRCGAMRGDAGRGPRSAEVERTTSQSGTAQSETVRSPPPPPAALHRPLPSDFDAAADPDAGGIAGGAVAAGVRGLLARQMSLRVAASPESSICACAKVTGLASVAGRMDKMEAL